MKKINNLSFKVKVIAMVLFVIISMGGATLFNISRFANSYSEGTLKEFKSYAERMGDRIGAQFFERYGDVQAFAMNELLQGMNTEAIQNELNEYVKLYGIYDLILMVDKNGKLISSNSADVSGKAVNFKDLAAHDYSNEPWFKAALEGKFTEDKDKGFFGTYVEGWLIDPVAKIAFGENRVHSSFTAPVKDAKGNIIAILTNRAGSRWVEGEFIGMYKDLEKQHKEQVGFYLFDSEGYVLLDYNPYETKSKEVAHDFEKILFKRNLVKDGNPAAIAVVKGETGSEIQKDERTGQKDLIGYHYIDNSKWIKSLGWSVYVREAEEEAFAKIYEAKQEANILLFANLIMAVCVAVWFAVIISKRIEKIIESLSSNATVLTSTSQTMASQATELSEASTEQAAALQETVAAIDEITAMVEKNADAAERSKQVSGQSREAATKGRDTVEQMIVAIEEINSSNQEISEQIQENTNQMNDITKLIGDINTKTKVINEIVFQTKLLSFNASVEAARAGEYGKGFAVVAEEVGNLAQMSGNAAKEITEMLEASVRKVETIVRETQTKMEKIIHNSQAKVQSGTLTAKECNQTLEEILANVASVDNLVSEISVASQEQSQGIREISKAIGQMEQVTQQNTRVAQLSSNEAEGLSSRSVELNEIVGSLVLMIKGEGHHASARKVKESTSKKLSPKKVFKTSSEFNNVVELKTKKEVLTATVKKAVGGHDLHQPPPSSDDPGFSE